MGDSQLAGPSKTSSKGKTSSNSTLLKRKVRSTSPISTNNKILDKKRISSKEINLQKNLPLKSHVNLNKNIDTPAISDINTHNENTINTLAEQTLNETSSSPLPFLSQQSQQCSSNTVNMSSPILNSIPSVPVSNRYETLSDMEEDCIVERQNEIKVHKPPPIKIKNLSNYHGLCSNLRALLGDNTFDCISSKSVVTVRTTNSDAYRTTVKYLQDNSYNFHTYQTKDSRPYRFVIRNLHYSTPPQVIKDDLEEKGFSVRNITNVLHPRTKEPLPLFFVDLEPAPHNSEVFNITSIYYSKVRRLANN
ncbi:hypothetical protein O3M35_006909 [Rhynocoris fuscipes]|uniref:Pre-C2HC domain-containing protein n=1 Tax=Rhynocoris fuscipes TaxID=488301 RepID=A0AAW1DKG4_9HEMI